MLDRNPVALRGPAGTYDAAAVYERYYPVVFAYACRHTRDYMTAEDVAAQAFVHALQALDRYEERGIPMTAWLLRITANLLAADGRRWRRELLPGAAPLEEDAAVSAEPTPEEWVVRWERAAWLHAQVALLPPEQRRVLWLRFGEGRSVAEIAGLIGRSPGATKQLLHRTIKALRGHMRVDTRSGTSASAARGCGWR